MKIKISICILLLCTLLSSCNLNNNDKNIYEDWPYEFRTEDYIIRGGTLHLYKKKLNIYENPNILDGLTIGSIGYGNFGKEIENITAKLYCYSTNKDGYVIHDTTFITEDFFSSQYKVDTMNTDPLWDHVQGFYYTFSMYSRYLYPKNLLTSASISKITVRFALYYEDGTLYDNPVVSSCNLTYEDDIVTYHGFTAFEQITSIN